MAFLDTTVPIHATGRSHPQLQPSAEVILAIGASPENVVSSSEVLQEILHFGVKRNDLDRARLLILRLQEILAQRISSVHAGDLIAAVTQPFDPALSARDRVHVAVMRRLGIDTIISADRDFDLVPGIRRLDPLDFEKWRDEVFG